MIVRSLNDLIDTARDVRGDVWASRRFLLEFSILIFDSYLSSISTQNRN